MTIKQARTTLRKADGSIPTVIEAAATVARSSDATLDDLLMCLDHGGLAAEFAALQLYRRTGRPLPSNPKGINLHRSEWEHFLATDPNNRGASASELTNRVGSRSIRTEQVKGI